MAFHSPIFFFFFLISCAAAAHNHSAPSDLVRSSCLHSRFPALCLHSLSAYPGPARTRADLARAAVSVSLTRVKKASDYLARLRARPDSGGAIADCLDQLSDAAVELADALKEVRAFKASGDSAEFRWHMSNAETWVSAALTDQDTCLDGIGSDVASDVKRRVKNVAKVASNALYLVDWTTLFQV